MPTGGPGSCPPSSRMRSGAHRGRSEGEGGANVMLLGRISGRPDIPQNDPVAQASGIYQDHAAVWRKGYIYLPIIGKDYDRASEMLEV